MELLFEKSTPGHGCDIFPACDVPVTSLPEALARKSALPLPELSETEISRHYTALANRAHGVNRARRKQRILPAGQLHHEIQPAH